MSRESRNENETSLQILPKVKFAFMTHNSRLLTQHEITFTKTRFHANVSLLFNSPSLAVTSYVSLLSLNTKTHSSHNTKLCL